MNPIIVPSESLKRWSALVARRPVPPAAAAPHTPHVPHRGGAAASDAAAAPTSIDPFDCSDLAVPPTHVLVEEELKRGARLWRDLDGRRVVPERTAETDPEYRGPGRKRRKRARVTSGGEGGVDAPAAGGFLKDECAVATAAEEDDKAGGEAPSAADDVDGNDIVVDVDEGGEIASNRLGGDYAGLDWGWHANRVRLPEGFDVSCCRGPPQRSAPSEPAAADTAAGSGGIVNNKDDGNGGKVNTAALAAQTANTRKRSTVISLLDPTDHLDYETELWKIFRSVPTEDEIEREATEGSVCTHLLELRAEVEAGLKDYARLDGHALGRMRLRDRHGLPSRIWASAPPGGAKRQLQQQQQQQQQQRPETVSGDADPAAPTETKFQGVTIRVECWRRMAKRGSSPDCHRLEIELWGGQTLEDLHRIVLELGRDGAGIVSIDQDGGGGGRFDGKTKIFSDSGMFFIEGAFYTCGEVDYASPVIEWLDGCGQSSSHDEEGNDGFDRDASMTSKNTERQDGQDGDAGNESTNLAHSSASVGDPVHSLRRNYLGILPRSSSDSTSTTSRQTVRPRPMSTVRLDSVPFRLGVRYLHVCDGDREVALFFTDVRAVLRDEDVSRYPLVHDVWTTSTPRPDCAGCGQRPPVVAAYRDELTEGDPTPLCGGCYRALHYRADGTAHRGGGDDMRVYPLGMMLGWADGSVGSHGEPVGAPF